MYGAMLYIAPTGAIAQPNLPHPCSSSFPSPQWRGDKRGEVISAAFGIFIPACGAAPSPAFRGENRN